MRLCGIDEAGRGPLAGPLVVAGVILHKPIKELNDSKQLSEKKREALFDQIKQNSDHHIVITDARVIDEIGLSKALKNSLLEIMEKLHADKFLMDGNTSFGISTLEHKIKADATVKEASAASILAKVTRDRMMVEYAQEFPEYEFEKHKGYGTKKHIELIQEYGLSPIHRKSFKLKSNEQKQPSLFEL